MSFQENWFPNLNLINLCRLKNYLFLLILLFNYQIKCDEPPQPAISGPVNWQRITHEWPATDKQFFYVIQNDETGEIHAQNYTWELHNLKLLLESEHDFNGDIELRFQYWASPSKYSSYPEFKVSEFYKDNKNKTQEDVHSIDIFDDKNWRSIEPIKLRNESKLVMVARLKTDSIIALRDFTFSFSSQKQIDNTTLGLDKTRQQRSFELTKKWFEQQMLVAEDKDNVKLELNGWDKKDLINGKENKYFTWDNIGNCSSAPDCQIPLVLNSEYNTGYKISIDVILSKTTKFKPTIQINGSLTSPKQEIDKDKVLDFILKKEGDPAKEPIYIIIISDKDTGVFFKSVKFYDDKNVLKKNCENRDDPGCYIFQDDKIKWSNLPLIDIGKYKQPIYYPKVSSDKNLLISFNNSKNDFDITITYWSRIPKDKNGQLNIRYTDKIDSKSIGSLYEFDLKPKSGSDPEIITFSLSDFLTGFGNDFQIEFELKCLGEKCNEYFQSNFAASFTFTSKSKFTISNSHEFLKITKDPNEFKVQWKSLTNKFLYEKFQFEYKDAWDDNLGVKDYLISNWIRNTDTLVNNMNKLALHQDKFDVLLLESPSNKLNPFTPTSSLPLLKDTKYLKFLIQFSTKKPVKDVKLDDIHVGSPCQQTNFQIDEKGVCFEFCKSKDFKCSPQNYLIDSPTHCQCTSPPTDKFLDYGATGWNKVLYPRKAPTTDGQLFYLNNSKCANSECQFNSDDFNLEDGRTLLFHVWFGTSKKVDSKITYKKITVNYDSKKDDINVPIDNWKDITLNVPIDNSKLNQLSITFDINQGEFIAFYDIAEKNTFKINDNNNTKSKVFVVRNENGHENQIVYRPTKQQNILKIPIENYNKIQLELENQAETRLELSYNEYGRHVLLADLFVDVNKKELTFELTKLEKDLKSVDSIELTVHTDDQGYKTLKVSHFKLDKSNYDSGTPINLLTHWKAKDFDPKKDWSDELVINTDNKNEKVEINKEIKFTGIKSNPGFKKSILIQSKWFYNNKDYQEIDGVYKVNFQVANNHNVTIDQFICDEHMHCHQLTSKDTSESDKIIKKEFKYSKSSALIGSLLKFVFKVTYEQSLEQSLSTLTITDFNFGDPCYDITKACIKENTDTCTPNSFATKHTCNCHKQGSNVIFYGDKCENPQYCFHSISNIINKPGSGTGEEYCKKLSAECISNDKVKFACICQTDNYWDDQSHNCAPIQTDINTNPSWLYYKQPLAASSESEKIIFVTGNEATITLGTLNIKKADFKSFGFRYFVDQIKESGYNTAIKVYINRNEIKNKVSQIEDGSWKLVIVDVNDNEFPKDIIYNIEIRISKPKFTDITKLKNVFIFIDNIHVDTQNPQVKPCTWEELSNPKSTDPKCRITFTNMLWTSHKMLPKDEVLYFPTSNNPLQVNMKLNYPENQDLDIEIDYFAISNSRDQITPNLLIQYTKQTDAISSSRGISFKPTIDSKDFLKMNVKLSAKKHLNPVLDKDPRISLYYSKSDQQINKIELTFLVGLPKIKVTIRKVTPTRTYLNKWIGQLNKIEMEKKIKDDWSNFNLVINNGLGEVTSHFLNDLKDNKYNFYLRNKVNNPIYTTSKLILSDWLKKTDILKTIQSSLKLKMISTDKTAVNFRLIPKLCSNYMICKTFSSSGESSVPNQPEYVSQNYFLNGNWNDLGSKIDYFRFVIEIDYIKPKDTSNLNSFMFDIYELHLNDACFNKPQSVCSNNGECKSQDYTVNNKEGFNCFCNPPFEAKSKCKEKDYCKNALVGNKEGDAYCMNEKVKSGANACINARNKLINGKNIPFRCNCDTPHYYWSDGSDPSKGKFGDCLPNPPKDNHYICNVTTKNNCNGKFNVIPEIHWSPKNFKTPNNNDPFYFPMKNGTKLDLSIKKYNKYWDVCFKFKYFISDNASLNLLVDNKKVDVNLTSIKTNDWSLEQQICVDDLNYNLKPDFTLSFENIFKNDSASVAIQFTVPIPTSFFQRKKLDSIPFISRWEKRDEVKPIDDLTFNNMWPFKYPQNGPIQIEPIKDNITFKANSQGELTLFSNWLNAKNSQDEFASNFRFFRPKGLGSFEILPLFCNELMRCTEIQKKQDPLLIDSYDNYPIKTKGPFKVGLKVVYSGSTSNDLTIGPIVLGDHCFTEDLKAEDNKSQKTPCKNARVCDRVKNDFVCDCGSDYFGKTCNRIDYCNKTDPIMNPHPGRDVCERAGATCIRVPSGGRLFSCHCGPSKYWKDNECVDVNDCFHTKCGLQQKCQLKDGKAQCECFNDYQKINDKCEPKDYCKDQNSNHCSPQSWCIQAGVGSGNIQCGCQPGYHPVNQNNCQPRFCSFPTLNLCLQTCDDKYIDNINDTIKYTCRCENNYILDESSKYKCNWHPNSDNEKECNCRNIQNAFCNYNNANDNCECKKGLGFNTTEKACRPIENFNQIDKSLCPNGEIEIKGGKLVCKCPDQFQPNNDGLCKLKDLCGKDFGAKTCKKIKAICKIDLNKKEGFECTCPDGLLHKNKTDSTSECVPACDLYNRTIICQNLGADCYQHQAFHLKHQIDNVNKTKLCRCSAGKTWNKDKTKCVYLKYSVKFELEFSIHNIKQEPKPTSKRLMKLKKISKRATKAIDEIFRYDIEGYRTAIKNQDQFNEEQLNSVRKEYQDEILKNDTINNITNILTSLYGKDNGVLDSDYIQISNCSSISNDKTKCQFIIRLDNPLSYYNLVEDTFNNFVKLCHKVSNDCIFALSNDRIAISNSVLDIKTFNKPNQLCTSMNNPCKEYSNFTSCKPYKDTSLFTCKCKKFYENPGGNVNPIPDFDSTSIDNSSGIEICQEKNHCYNNSENYCGTNKDVECVSYQIDNLIKSGITWDQLEQEPHRLYNCTCKNNEHFFDPKNKQCSAICGDKKCNHGKCVPKSPGYYCECENGWSGDHCDVEHTVGVGGWIAAVVILAVGLVLAVGAAIVCFRRSKKASSHSDHRLDDYTNNAYRVGQSGQTGYQPTAPQRYGGGNVNQGFSRD